MLFNDRWKLEMVWNGTPFAHFSWAQDTHKLFLEDMKKSQIKIKYLLFICMFPVQKLKWNLLSLSCCKFSAIIFCWPVGIYFVGRQESSRNTYIKVIDGKTSHTGQQSTNLCAIHKSQLITFVLSALWAVIEVKSSIRFVVCLNLLWLNTQYSIKQILKTAWSFVW